MWLAWSKAVPKNLVRYVIPDVTKKVNLSINRHDALVRGEYRQVVEAIYMALSEREAGNSIRYAHEKFSYEDELQHIRTPEEILDKPGEGTCLDLAILFCGLCLGFDLLPLLVVIEGHALAAVSLIHGRREWDSGVRSERHAFDKGLLCDGQKLHEWLERGMYVAVECTGFAHTDLPASSSEGEGRINGKLPFESAVQVGAAHITRGDRAFQFALDVAALQQTWKLFPYRPDAADTVAYAESLVAAEQIEDRPPEPGSEPYKGLAPFTKRDASFFFGRERLQAKLVGRLKDSRFLAIVGASGCGKSSLIHAGIIPTLEHSKPLADASALPANSEHWEIQAITPTEHPLESLATALTYDIPDDTATASLERAMMQDPRALVRSVDKLLRRQERTHLLLVVDQFEELFALCRDPAKRQAFVDNLLAAVVDDQAPLTVLIALRADFYAQCSQYDDLREMVAQHQEFVGRMSDEELFSAIVRPAREGNWKIQEGLPALMLQDIGDEPGALPLLSHVLLKTWEERSGRTMTIAGYQAVGRLQGAIAQTAEAVFAKLAPEQISVARHIFLRLTELGEGTRHTRRRATLTQLVTPAIGRDSIEDVLTMLTPKRLITAEEGAYTIVHDALIHHWQRLRDWLAEYPRLLRLREGILKASCEWMAQGENEDYLDHRGKRLREVEVLLTSTHVGLSEEEHRYIRACQAADQPEEANIANMGWGVIFAHDVDPAVREALRELLDYRKGQVLEKNPSYYHELEYGTEDKPIESNREFLNRYDVGSTRPEPDRMPYYLLIVGDPERIPFTFQYQLDAQYAVGRIHFDEIEEYRRYAHSVVQAEKEHLTLPRRACIFAVENPGDLATRLATNELVMPLFETLKEQLGDRAVELISGDQATKEHLGRLLGGDKTPALLFTCGHGVSFPLEEEEKQFSSQGALVCRDWRAGGDVTEEHYFSASDVSPDAQLRGTILFFWGCYGAGTPKLADFAHMDYRKDRMQIAPHAFIARLPKRLLSHPNGGALAAIGAVERKWTYSFAGELGAKDRHVFESALRQLMESYPVGAAMEFFNQRYVALTAELVSHFERSWYGEVNKEELNHLWSATNDARNYVILGDPAVRLRVANLSQNAANPEE